MRAQQVIGSFFLLFTQTVPAQVCTQDDASCNNDVPCGVYMAESTIGQANLGIFTGVDLKENDIVNYPEIVVPLLFRDWAYHGDNPDGTLWDRYIWDAPSVDMEPKQSDLKREDSAAVFVPGVGCTINSYLELNNIMSTHGSEYDAVGLHRSRDPGAGAFSPYHASKTTMSENVVAGTELFASYGDQWIPEIPGAVIAYNENLDEADEYLGEYADWMNQSDLDDDVKEGLWELTNHFPLTSPLTSALPRSVTWKEVADEVAAPSANSTVRHFIKRQGKRSVEWLKENGKCQDHLKPGNSTLPQAGRGAFAARNLPKGTVVAFAPLIHIGNQRGLLQIEYNHDGNRMKGVHDRHRYTAEDLVINYSFSHPESTLLLTPYGAMVNYINHHREGANVRVEWPKEELVAHKPIWLNKSVEFLQNTHEKIGLSFDYIALRDIEEGEEIFMDYGDEWIAAWQKHVDNWKPVGPVDYQHSSTWTETHLRTVSEQVTRPYPANLHTLCVDSYTEVDGRSFYLTPLQPTYKRVYCDILERLPAANDPGNFFYTVRLRPEPKQGQRSKFVLVYNVPRSDQAVNLYDKLQSADWHLEHAFRHPITLPDHVMRENWKNK